MSEEETTKPYTAYELDEPVWGNMFKNNQCPICKNPLEQYRNIEPGRIRYFMACNKCCLFFIPKPKQQTKPREKEPVSVSKLEKAAERSGFSRYEPLNIHYFCGKCWKNDMDKLQRKINRTSVQGLKTPKPTGLEGMSHTLVRNRSRMDEVNLTLPFTCKCGDRYYLDVTLRKRDKRDYYLFGVQMGYHADCMGCPMAWNISVGKDDMNFRCDLNLNCVIIKDKKHHFIMVDEDESTLDIEDME